MLSDSQGQFVTGVDVSTGQSHVDYMPYGEIDRKDSDGPDIFRYKFSGQIEDANTGFYYYRARYYDPVIGRFTQADAFADAMQPMGLNRYMYTVGNPVRYRDPSGHNAHIHMFNQIIRHIAHMANTIIRGIVGPRAAKAMTDAAHNAARITQPISGGVRWAAEAVKSTIDRIAGGKKSTDSTNTIDTGFRKLREFGTGGSQHLQQLEQFRWILVRSVGLHGIAGR